MQHSYKIRTFRTASLSEEVYDSVVQQIKELYLWFAPDSTDEAIHERLHRNPGTSIDIITDVDGMCAGFSVYHCEVVEGKRVMFRGGTVIRDRSIGLYKQVLSRSIYALKPVYLIALTQNPRVYESLRCFSVTGRAYPAPGEDPPAEVQEIAAHYCTMPGFDPTTLVAPNIYESIRKENTFKQNRDNKVAALFAEKLDTDDGFAVVVPIA